MKIEYLFIIIGLAVATNIRYVKSSERHAVFKSGRFQKLVGPGLVFIPPSLPSVRRFKLKISHRLESAGENLAGFTANNSWFELPCVCEPMLPEGEMMRITAFGGDGGSVVCEPLPPEPPETPETDVPEVAKEG